MDDKLREQISALADDELPEAERDLLLRRLSADPALRSEWGRLHLIRDALHNELPAGAGDALSYRVMTALENDPQPVLRHTPAGLPRQFAKPLAGLAVAASVAAMAVIGLQHLAGHDAGPVAATPRLAAVDTPTQSEIVGTRWDQPQMGTRLNAYLVNHSEYTSGSSLQGMMNYVRIAGYDSSN